MRANTRSTERQIVEKGCNTCGVSRGQSGGYALSKASGITQRQSGASCGQMQIGATGGNGGGGGGTGGSRLPMLIFLGGLGYYYYSR